MSRPVVAALTCTFLTLSLASCGGGTTVVSKSSSTATGASSSAAPSSTASSTTGAASAAPTLTAKALDAAMVDVADLPAGFVRDTKSEAEASASKSATSPRTSSTGPKPSGGCDFESLGGDSEPTAEAGREFTKGEGLASEMLMVNASQYESESAAKESFRLGDEALASCKSLKVSEDMTFTITKGAPAKVGDETGMVKMSTTIEELPVSADFQYVRVGSTLFTVVVMKLAGSPEELRTQAATKQAEKLKVALTSAK